MTKVITNLNSWFDIRNTLDGSLGFVPTMGALHKGHESLIKKSVEENDITLVSIFVNPTQFNDKNDFRNYPKTFDDDFSMIEKCGVDYLLLPDYESLFPDNYKYRVTEKELSLILEGEHRPGHFDGVLSVVIKLLNIVKANKAYFGEKDFQQYKLIDGMTKTFFINTKIVQCETVRESDGLAYSSRNLRLTKEQRSKAPLFYSMLNSKKNIDEIILELKLNGFEVDYIKEIDNRRYGAVFLGNVRLIDNVKI